MIITTKKGFNYFIQFFLSFLTLFFFFGCQKVINVDLNEAAPAIVIEGLITDRQGPYVITVSKSGSYFNQPVLPPVSGAEVIISDNYGTIDTLLEKKPGVYVTSKIRGISGRTYTIKVLSENREYTGSSTMNYHVSIDSLNLTKSQSRPFGALDDNQNEIHIDLNCYFNDPYGKNYYRLIVFRNDTARSDNYRLYDDQYSDGQELWLRAAHAEVGNKYRLELYSLDKATYGYYRTLEDLIHSNPIFGSTPANPDSNLSNGALGYFGACAISSKTIFITASMLDEIR